MKKLYAYSDDDGYIHYHVLGDKKKQFIWNNQTKSFLKRENEFDQYQLPFWYKILIISLVLALVALTHTGSRV